MRNLSYANITATLALFIALGGTSYAVLSIGSQDVRDNSLRSRDLRDNSLRSRDLRDHTVHARDVRRDGLGGGAIKEERLRRVPLAGNAERFGGKTVADLTVHCPADAVVKLGACLEPLARPAQPFSAALSVCHELGRTLPSMPELDRLARSHGPLSNEGEWTSSIYLEGPSPGNLQLRAVVVGGSGDVGAGQPNTPETHPFRCVALPSN